MSCTAWIFVFPTTKEGVEKENPIMPGKMEDFISLSESINFTSLNVKTGPA